MGEGGALREHARVRLSGHTWMYGLVAAPGMDTPG